MKILEIEPNVFDDYASSHALASFYQTSMYGKSMRKLGYTDMYIGIYDGDALVGASLILVKSISINVKYGYAPRGILTDYLKKDEFNLMSEALRKYFSKKGFAFIKINPLITYSEVNFTNNTKNYNELALNIMDLLEENNYKKLKDNIYFESMLPKYNPIVNLAEFDFTSLDIKLQNKLNKINNKGLKLIKGDFYNINSLYELIKRKDNIKDEFYKELYKNFNEKNMIDLFLVEVDYHEYLSNLGIDHATEETINEKINKLFQMNPSDKTIYNEKMKSDKKLVDIKNEIVTINDRIRNGIYKEIVAGALIIKNKNVASILTSGFKKEYNKILPNHFMHYMLLNHYKKEGFSFMDLNGITADFSKDNPYRGLNEFKLSWNPKVYEYIGEFDFIINQNKYALLWSTKKLHKEFEKPNLKTEKK